MENRLVSNRVLIALIIVGSVFLLTAGAAIAAGSAREHVSQPVATTAGGEGVSTLAATPSVSGTEHVTGSQMIAGCIATLFEVPISDVVDLRVDGYGFGEIAKMYFFAQDAGLTVEEIIDLRELGMGWGEIARYVGLPPSNRDRKLGQIISGRTPASGTLPVAAQRLAERLGATPEEVAALLDEGANYGTVVVAYKLAGMVEGVTPEGLVTQRLAGSSWGQIRKDLASAPTSSGESDQGPPEDKGRPDHAGPPDHTGPKDSRDHSGPPDHAGPKKDKKK
jgi:hypothetical protein